MKSSFGIHIWNMSPTGVGPVVGRYQLAGHGTYRFRHTIFHFFRYHLVEYFLGIGIWNMSPTEYVLYVGYPTKIVSL
jgi:hypothetical protein